MSETRAPTFENTCVLIVLALLIAASDMSLNAKIARLEQSQLTFGACKAATAEKAERDLTTHVGRIERATS